MKIERISERTFRVVEGTLDDLAATLTARGWNRLPPASPHEFARFWATGRRALIIVYRAGTLVAQGKEPFRALDALRECVVDARWKV